MEMKTEWQRDSALRKRERRSDEYYRFDYGERGEEGRSDDLFSLFMTDGRGKGGDALVTCSS